MVIVAPSPLVRAKPSLPSFASCDLARTTRPLSTPASLIARLSFSRPNSTRGAAPASTSTVAAAPTEAALMSTSARTTSSLLTIDPGRFLLRHLHRVPLHARDAQRDVRLAREPDLAQALGVVTIRRVLDDLERAV